MNKLIYKISTVSITILLGMFLLAPVSSFAFQDPGGGGSGTKEQAEQLNGGFPSQKCGSNEVLLDNGKSCCPKSAGKNPTSCLYAKYINPLVNLLSAAVGIIVVVAIIVGAIQFSSAAGDPQKAANGKKHIQNALLGLLAYLLLYAFLQFIIPGGLLNATK